MKKNNNIIKLLTTAFVAIGLISQVYAMDDSSPTPSRSGSVSGSVYGVDGLEPQAHFERVCTTTLQGAALQLCADLFDDLRGRVTLETILSSVSAMIGGNDAREDLKKTDLHRTIVNAVVLGAITRLSEYHDPNDPRSLFVVGRLISFLLLDTQIPTAHSWLSRIRLGAAATSKQEVLAYLMGGADEPGVIPTSLGDIATNGNITHDISLEEISLSGLSGMFCAAAEIFPNVLHMTNATYNQQRAFLEAYRSEAARGSRVDRGYITHEDFSIRKTIRILAGMRTTYSMFDVLNEAVLRADAQDHAYMATDAGVAELRRVSGEAALQKRLVDERNAQILELRRAAASRVDVPVESSSWSPYIKVGSVAALIGGGVVFLAMKIFKK